MQKESRDETPKSIKMFKVYTHLKWRKPRGIDQATGQTIKSETGPDYSWRSKTAASDIYFKSPKAAKFFVDNHKLMFFKAKSDPKKKIRYGKYPNKYYRIKESQFMCQVKDYKQVITDDPDVLGYWYSPDGQLKIYLLSSLIKNDKKED